MARMLTLAAKPLGLHVVVVDAKANCPAAQVGADEIIAAPGDRDALEELISRSDALTVEFEEFFDVDILLDYEKSNKTICPAPKTLAIIKDKYRQKIFMADKGVAVGPFAKFTDGQKALNLLKNFGGKMVIKTRQGGYDGNGNAIVASQSDIDNALKRFAGRQLYAEAYVPFSKELAVMAVRDRQGNIVTYPVVETIHTRNICDEVLAPANLPVAIIKKAQALAKQTASHLEGAGLFGIEMFLTKDNRVLLNEIAPRVHNSGHYTIEACVVSQFEQHVRAVMGLPLGDVSMVHQAAVMKNILGERSGPVNLRGLDKALSRQQTKVHIYGKTPTRVDRKMGHITSVGATLEEARQNARAARSDINI